MSDATAGEMPAEPAPPIPPGAEATAELDAATPQAVSVDGLAPATDDRSTNVEDGSGNTNDDNGVRDETSTNVESAAAPAAERALPFDVDHLGVLRRSVLDALVDADEALNVSRILAEMPPGTTRGSAESAIRREWDAGRIERVGPGLYVLAKAKPPEPKPAPPPESVRADGISDDRWLAWLADWRATGKWDAPGNPPGHSGCAVPPGVIAKHNDAVRKRQERQRERDAAAAKRSAADRELRDRLIAATGGNIVRGPGLEDVAPIKLALEVVPLERILSSIRYKTDRKLYPRNEPATSWGERRLLKAIAEDYCSSVIVPSLVAAWEAAGSPAPTAEESLPPAGDMPDDIDELRSHHDSEHAPPGPHNLPKPDAAPSAPDTAQKPADASEPLPAVSATPDVSRRARSLPRNGLLGRKIRPPA
jgi:hypothetical protein